MDEVIPEKAPSGSGAAAKAMPTGPAVLPIDEPAQKPARGWAPHVVSIAPTTLMNIDQVIHLDLTNESAKQKLARGFYLQNGDTITIEDRKTKPIYVVGMVNKPGEYPLVVPTRVFQALVNAGGFKDFANQKKITIIHEDNKRDLFNYKEVLQGKKLDQNIYLKPGDIIVVK